MWCEGGLRNNVSKVSHLLNTLYSKSNSHIKSNSPYNIERLSRRTFLKVRSLLKSPYKTTVKLTFEKFFQRLLLHILRAGSKDMARVLALCRIIRCPHTIRCPRILQVLQREELLFLSLYVYTTIFLLQPRYHIPRCASLAVATAASRNSWRVCFLSFSLSLFLSFSLSIHGACAFSLS